MGSISSQRLQGRIHFFDFSSFQRQPISLAHGSFFHLQSQLHSVESAHHLIQPSYLPITSTFKDPCDYFGPTQIFQEIFHVSRSSFHFMLAEIITATTFLFLIYLFCLFPKNVTLWVFLLPPIFYLILPHATTLSIFTILFRFPHCKTCSILEHLLVPLCLSPQSL